MYLSNDLHRLAVTATILTLDQKPCLKVIAYYYSGQVSRQTGRCIQNKWNRTERDEQPDQYKYSPYRAGPYGSIRQYYLLTLTNSIHNKIWKSNINCNPSYMQDVLSINACMHNFTDCTKSFMLEQTVLCLYVIYFYWPCWTIFIYSKNKIKNKTKTKNKTFYGVTSNLVTCTRHE